MKDIKRKEKIWLIVAISSISVGALSIIADILFAMNLMYAPLIIFLILTAHGFYGAPFYYNAYANTKATRKIMAAVEEKGMINVSEAAAVTGLKELFAKKHIEKHFGEKGIPGYAFDGKVLKKSK